MIIDLNYLQSKINDKHEYDITYTINSDSTTKGSRDSQILSHIAVFEEDFNCIYDQVTHSSVTIGGPFIPDVFRDDKNINEIICSLKDSNISENFKDDIMERFDIFENDFALLHGEKDSDKCNVINFSLYKNTKVTTLFASKCVMVDKKQGKIKLYVIHVDNNSGNYFINTAVIDSVDSYNYEASKRNGNTVDSSRFLKQSKIFVDSNNFILKGIPYLETNHIKNREYIGYLRDIIGMSSFATNCSLILKLTDNADIKYQLESLSPVNRLNISLRADNTKATFYTTISEEFLSKIDKIDMIINESNNALSDVTFEDKSIVFSKDSNKTFKKDILTSVNKLSSKEGFTVTGHEHTKNFIYADSDKESLYSYIHDHEILPNISIKLVDNDMEYELN